jgi:hypothetical protein
MVRERGGGGEGGGGTGGGRAGGRERSEGGRDGGTEGERVWGDGGEEGREGSENGREGGNAFNCGKRERARGRGRARCYLREVDVAVDHACKTRRRRQAIGIIRAGLREMLASPLCR